MITHIHGARAAQRGIVLVSSLLLLLVVTIIALSMFRSFGIQEKIAGNMREKQRALQAAVSAQQYAEWWLSTSSIPTSTCSTMMSANLNEMQICSNPLTNVTSAPWGVGVTYTPPNMLINNPTTPVANLIGNPTYYNAPAFYVTDLGPSQTSLQGEVYQIDAVGYGGNANTVSEVESTYLVYTTGGNKGGL